MGRGDRLSATPPINRFPYRKEGRTTPGGEVASRMLPRQFDRPPCRAGRSNAHQILMARRFPAGISIAALAAFGIAPFSALPGESQQREIQIARVSPVIGDERAVSEHLDQALIDRGRMSFGRLVAHGKLLFDAAFTEADGQGRPSQNGVFPAANRTARVAPENFNRISGPDSDSCSGCHNKPRSGGGGDTVANVFVLAQRFSFFDNPFEDDENGLPAPLTLRGAADERNTLGMFGSGAIEMLAREMTTELHAIRARAVQQAASGGSRVTLPLETKGVNFGAITADPDGTVSTGAVEGVNADLIIRPFHQKGVVVSLREFTNNAYPHHHGMQPVERFGVGTDSDGDGVVNELSVGDITAATLYQAQLGIPGQVIPRNVRVAAAVRKGEQLFTQIGCAGCHRPELTLDSPYYTEPNPFNPPHNLRPEDVVKPFHFDLTRQGEGPRLTRKGRGKVVVRAFTDLKRHDLGDHPLINNEKLIQGGVPTSVFITKKLWGFASEPHFLHNGRATTISAAILAHGGEAQAIRNNFAALSDPNRRCVIEFLKSLQVLPEDARGLVVDEFGRPVPGAR